MRSSFLILSILTCLVINAIAQDYITAQGQNLLYKNDKIALHGVSFGNQVWSNVEIPEHHDQVDFLRVKKMGMNCVRFYLNYKTLEDDERPFKYKESGWKWLDKNIEWAKKHGVFLIINIHVPQGGFQSNGKGGALWTNQTNQSRLIKLWGAIAARYSKEPTIAGYDLLNEPVTTQSKTQWEYLAKSITKEIRSQDTNHMIIVERLNAIGKSWNNDLNMNFFKLDDSNVCYEFHFYSPFEYTHQNTPWTGLGNGGRYPDHEKIVFPYDLTWHTSTFDNPKILTGNQDWTFYEGKKYMLLDSNVVSAKPALEASKLGLQGSVMFGQFSIQEFDSSQKFTREILVQDAGRSPGWELWSKNGEGNFRQIDNFSANNKSALRISETSNYANVYNNSMRFIPKIGYYYSISGWAKPEMVSWDANSLFRIDFETSPSNNTPVTRDISFLKKEINKYLQWGIDNNVPIYLGEFGVYKDCFKKKKGGINWVADMLDICLEKNIPFTYHTYNEGPFGIYDGSGPQATLSEPNQELIDLFKMKLKP